MDSPAESTIFISTPSEIPPVPHPQHPSQRQQRLNRPNLKMFDVIWTDHNRELVGERRARKGQGKPDKVQDDETLISDDSGFTSISTGSFSSSLDKSSASEKSPGFLGSLRFKKSYIFSRNKNAASTESPTSSPERRTFLPPPSAPSTAATSFYSATSEERLPRSPATVDGRPFIEYLKSPWRNTPIGTRRGIYRSSTLNFRG